MANDWLCETATLCGVLRWPTHLFSISTDSVLPRGRRYFMWSLPIGDGSHVSSLSPPTLATTKRPLLYVESPDGSRVTSLSPPTRYYQEAATLCGVPRWFTHLLSQMSPISTDSLLARGKTGVFFVHLAKHAKIICQQKKSVSYHHQNARGKTVVFFCPFSKADNSFVNKKNAKFLT